MNTVLLFILFLSIQSKILYSAHGFGYYNEVNHYQYAITWSPTYCKYLIGKKECISDLPERFYTHGIWAGDANGNLVMDCRNEKGKRNPPISNSALNAYEQKLSISWPPIEKGMSNFSYWGHEYNKHGVCFKGWSDFEYLGFVDKVSVNNNITKLLEKNGIKKSSTVKYSRDAIEKAIQDKIGAGFNIYLGCQKVGTLYYLKNAAMCIKKNDTKYKIVYEFVSCPANNDQTYNNCGGGKKEENIILLSRV